MKRIVNGNEVDLAPSGAQVIRHDGALLVRHNGQTRSALAVRSGDDVFVSYQGRQFVVSQGTKKRHRVAAIGSGEIRAPMPGAIVDVLVKEGQSVAKGDKLVVIEAMKTQQPFTAPFDGVVASVRVEVGAQVVDGQVLVQVQTNSDSDDNR